MVEQADFLFEFWWVVTEAVFLGDVLLGYSLDIVEVFLPQRQYLSRIIKIHPIAPIIQQIPNPILTRIVNPLLHGHLLPHPPHHLFILLILGLLKDPLTLNPLYLLGFDRRPKATAIPLRIHEAILRFVLLQWELLAGDDVVVCVEFAVVGELALPVGGLFVGGVLHEVAGGGLDLEEDGGLPGEGGGGAEELVLFYGEEAGALGGLFLED